MRYTSKTKLALSASLLLMWVALIATESRALFNDSATLNGNAITTGSMSLLVSNSQSASSTTYEEVREGFSFNLLPGQSAEKYFLLKNTSPADAAFEIAVSLCFNAAYNSDLARNIMVDITAVDGEGTALSTPVVHSTAFELAENSLPVLGPLIPKGGYQRYKLKTSLAESYAIPNDVAAYDLTFIGTQKNI